MEEVTPYHAVVERDSRWWLVHVLEIDKWTQARRLSDVEAMARDLIAVMTETDPDSFDLDVQTTLPAAALHHLERARSLREEADRAKSEAASEWRAAAKVLADAGLTVREIGQSLQVSYQRAQQLVSA